MTGMEDLSHRAKKIGKRRFILRYGVFVFGIALLLVNIIRFFFEQGMAVSAFGSREFAEVILQVVIGAPVMGAVWGWIMWKIVT